MPESDNISLYDAHATTLADQYDRVTTEQAVPILPSLLSKGNAGRALDIGSGAGRDALWLAQRGWQVDSMDGSEKLLLEAQKRHPHARIDYYVDLAPAFARSAAKGTPYDLILMSAFLFHFDKEEREDILKNCLGMLSQNGLMHLTLRVGPLISDRKIYLVDPAELEDFSKVHGLSCHYHGRSADNTGRGAIAWDHVSLWRGERWNHARTLTT